MQTKQFREGIQQLSDVAGGLLGIDELTAERRCLRGQLGQDPRPLGTSNGVQRAIHGTLDSADWLTQAGKTLHINSGVRRTHLTEVDCGHRVGRTGSDLSAIVGEGARGAHVGPHDGKKAPDNGSR